MSGGAVIVLEQLVRRRRALGLRQRDMAELMGVKQSTVATFERAERGNPRIETLERYAEALGARLIWKIIGDEELPGRSD